MDIIVWKEVVLNLWPHLCCKAMQGLAKKQTAEAGDENKSFGSDGKGGPQEQQDQFIQEAVLESAS